MPPGGRAEAREAASRVARASGSAPLARAAPACAWGAARAAGASSRRRPATAAPTSNQGAGRAGETRRGCGLRGARGSGRRGGGVSVDGNGCGEAAPGTSRRSGKGSSPNEGCRHVPRGRRRWAGWGAGGCACLSVSRLLMATPSGVSAACTARYTQLNCVPYAPSVRAPDCSWK